MALAIKMRHAREKSNVNIAYPHQRRIALLSAPRNIAFNGAADRRYLLYLLFSSGLRRHISPPQNAAKEEKRWAGTSRYLAATRHAIVRAVACLRAAHITLFARVLRAAQS